MDSVHARAGASPLGLSARYLLLCTRNTGMNVLQMSVMRPAASKARHGGLGISCLRSARDTRGILRFAGRPLALELCVHSTGLARHLLPVPATLIHHLTPGLRPRLRALARIGSSKHFACRLRLPALTFADCQLTEGGRETDTQRRDGM